MPSGAWSGPLAAQTYFTARSGSARTKTRLRAGAAANKTASEPSPPSAQLGTATQCARLSAAEMLVSRAARATSRAAPWGLRMASTSAAG